ncbi:hypothetical protein CPLU01_01402 [Colletotrichum plurivorum]|uniref:Fungal specific transcription factor domain containing protein n=1 Tax=Colletotrichum plurivorum TaxID=2175906 RepID=A0A8H6NPB7_9PEZI|nr:hypothetical protein CPLU01_01402 [Colletotrichum plurivorum]
MPLARPTTQCCRAIQQQIRAPLDDVWVTDGMLAQAFERYCYVSHLARRRSSFVPGPLEGKRRLGKRKMTDLHMDNGSTLPPWAIEFPVDLRRWKWQPPTARSSNETREPGLPSSDSASDFSGILRWWHSKCRTTEEIRPTKEELEQIGKEPLAPSIALLASLSKARSAVAASTSDALPLAFYNFIGGLQQDLKLGVLDLKVVTRAVSTFPQSLMDTPTDRDVVNAAIEMFLSAVVHGIASSKVLGPTEFNGNFWNRLLLRISQLQDNDATNSLLRTTLDAVPLRHVNDVHEGFVAAVQRLIMSRSTDPGRAADIGVALRKLNTFSHKKLLHKIEAAVDEDSNAFVPATRQKLRFLWLQTLAHMPHIRQDDLWDACVRLSYFDPKNPGPIGRDLSQLLIQQWSSRGYLRRQEALESRCNRDANESEKLSLAALPVNMLSMQAHSVPSTRLLLSLFAALRRFGREAELIESIESLCEARKKLPIQPFIQLAIHSRDHRIALMIHSIVKSYRTKVSCYFETKWHWTHWELYIKDIIMDRELFLGTVWGMVDLGISEDTSQKGYKELSARRKRLFADMAVWFSEASHLNDSQAKRNVEKCVVRIHKQGEALPDKVIQALASVATRELKRGERGRTDRMRWMLGLLEQYKGSAQRCEVQRVLEKWRRINEELMTSSRGGMIGGPR